MRAQLVSKKDISVNDLAALADNIMRSQTAINNLMAIGQGHLGAPAGRCALFAPCGQEIHLLPYQEEAHHRHEVQAGAVLAPQQVWQGGKVL